VDRLLNSTLFRISAGKPTEELRFALFLVVSLLLGLAIRRLAEQRAQLINQELQQKLTLAETERRLAEEYAIASAALRARDDVLQIALRASGMGLWVWDLKDNVVHRSDEVYRMVGCEPGSFGSEPYDWLKYVHPEDVAGLKNAIERARTVGADYHCEYRVRWPDGSVRWLESQGKCQRDYDGEIIRLVGVMVDVTNRKQAEDAMLRAEKLAVAGRLAASVAHEINNPLEAVANLLYLISTADTMDTARTHASSGMQELMRVSLITQSTLKFHRMSGSPKVVLLSEVLEGILVLFRGKLAAMEIELDSQTNGEVPIACMPTEAQQIFANLLSNAIEAMPNKGRLRIRLRRSRDWRDEKPEGMRFTISDTGSGMDRATMRRIFEPFYTTKTDTGTGLGLWVVAQLVDRHKGRVGVWSWQLPNGSGTAFSVFLPVGDETEETAASASHRGEDAKGPRSEKPDRELQER
jgi:PAS domain S-box-containing protein